MAQRPFQAGVAVNLDAGESVKDVAVCTVPPPENDSRSNSSTSMVWTFEPAPLLRRTGHDEIPPRHLPHCTGGHG